VTPVIETMRGLLMGGPIGANGWLAVMWCLLILVASWTAAGLLFRRRSG
jgi:ABC-2 type transport system permease protein